MKHIDNMSEHDSSSARVWSTSQQISELVSKYVFTLDNLDTPQISQQGDVWYESIFTSDVKLSFPIGGYLGTNGLAAFHAVAKGRFESTFHMSTDHVVAAQATTATATATATVMAFHRHRQETLDARGHSATPIFRVGGRYDISAIETPDGWRISALAFRVEWSEGDEPDRS